MSATYKEAIFENTVAATSQVIYENCIFSDITTTTFTGCVFKNCSVMGRGLLTFKNCEITGGFVRCVNVVSEGSKFANCFINSITIRTDNKDMPGCYVKGVVTYISKVINCKHVEITGSVDGMTYNNCDVLIDTNQTVVNCVFEGCKLGNIIGQTLHKCKIKNCVHVSSAILFLHDCDVQGLVTRKPVKSVSKGTKFTNCLSGD